MLQTLDMTHPIAAVISRDIWLDVTSICGRSLLDLKYNLKIELNRILCLLAFQAWFLCNKNSRPNVELSLSLENDNYHLKDSFLNSLQLLYSSALARAIIKYIHISIALVLNGQRAYTMLLHYKKLIIYCWAGQWRTCRLFLMK